MDTPNIYKLVIVNYKKKIKFLEKKKKRTKNRKWKEKFYLRTLPLPCNNGQKSNLAKEKTKTGKDNFIHPRAIVSRRNNTRRKSIDRHCA